MSEPLPAGFDGLYRCKNHPERDAVAPIACRLCRECREDALRNYAEQKPAIKWRPEHDTTPWGEKLDETRVRKRRETV